MTSHWLASGTCNVGVAVEPLTLRDDLGMAGYSWSGIEGTTAKEELYARALGIQAANGTLAVICIVDLMCPSLALTAKVAEKAAGAVPPEHVMLLGTHTHSAPGHYYHNSFFRYFAQPWVSGYMDYRADWVDDLAESIALAIQQVAGDLHAGWVGVDRRPLWGASRNRSREAFLMHPAAANWNLPGHPGESAPGVLDAGQLAVDPRVTTIIATVDDQPRAAFGWFGCHATALGPDQPTYHGDWPGQAVAALEAQFAQHAGFHAAVGLAASGDVSPLPDLGDTGGQGEALATSVGHKVADAMAQSVQASAGGSSGSLPVQVCAGSWAPKQENPGLDWEAGWPMLGGAEDGRSFLHPWFSEEGMSDGGPPPAGDTQHPKQRALGIIQTIIGMFGLDIAPWHPWQRLVLGNHALVAVPGEATTIAAHVLETGCVEALAEVESATVVGYCGDYAGYFTTEEEYGIQHYEGSATLYGRPSLASLEAAVAGPCEGYQEFPVYPESTSDEATVQASIAMLVDSPVLATVPAGHRDGEQVFAIWIGNVETKPEYLSLQDESGKYPADRVKSPGKDAVITHSDLLPGADRTLLFARFPGAPTRPGISADTEAPVLHIDDGVKRRTLKCRDGRNIGTV